MDTEKKTGMLKKIGLGRIMMALAVLLYAVKGVSLAFLSMFADWKRKKKGKDAISA